MRALIVEDDTKLARILSRTLTEEGFTCDLCGNGADALVQARSMAYDVILLDWMLPGKDGLEVCGEVRRGGVITPILMLSARTGVEDRVRGLQTGADDYLPKPFKIDELVARVHALTRRAAGFAMLRVGALQLDRVNHRLAVAGQPVELTAREYAVLLHLAQRPDQVVTRSELLAQIWEITFHPGSNLIEVMISRLREKLGEYSWMIDTVRGQGYCLRSRRPPRE